MLPEGEPNPTAASCAQQDLWARRRLLVLSWEAFGDAVSLLERDILESRYRPTSIVGIARGGLILAAALANRLKIRDFGAISVVRNLSDSRYSNRGEAEFHWMAPSPWDLSGRRLLVVDDIAGDGATMARAVEELRVRSAKSLRTVVLVRNRNCEVPLDHHAFIADDWVVFPWESPPQGEPVELLTP